MFFCWYFVNAMTRLRKTGSRYGARFEPASSSNVAKALQPASCTRLLLSSTMRKSYVELTMCGAIGKRRTPSIVGTKNVAKCSGEVICVHQPAYRPRVQHAMHRNNGYKSLSHKKAIKGAGRTLGSFNILIKYGIRTGK